MRVLGEASCVVSRSMFPYELAAMVKVKCPSFTPTPTVGVISLSSEIVNLWHFDASIKFFVREYFVKRKLS